jgi:hypothetical protein
MNIVASFHGKGSWESVFKMAVDLKDISPCLKKITVFLFAGFVSRLSALNVSPPMGANCKVLCISLLSRNRTVLLQSKQSSSKKMIAF